MATAPCHVCNAPATGVLLRHGVAFAVKIANKGFAET
jgi:hypothetical protein